MGDPFRHVTTGEKLNIPATAYNAMLDAAIAHRHGQINATVNTKSRAMYPGMIRVKNLTEYDLTRYQNVRLGEPVFTDTGPEEMMTDVMVWQGLPPVADSIDENGGHPPEHESERGKFAIVIQPIPKNEIGWAVIDGVVPAYVKDLTDEYGNDTVRVDMSGHVGWLTGHGAGAAKVLWPSGGALVPTLALIRLGLPNHPVPTGDVVGDEDWIGVAAPGDWTDPDTGGMGVGWLVKHIKSGLGEEIGDLGIKTGLATWDQAEKKLYLTFYPIDEAGHVLKPTPAPEPTEIDLSILDEKVRATNDSDPGFLDQVLLGADDWISTEVVFGVMEITHTGPSTQVDGLQLVEVTKDAAGQVTIHVNEAGVDARGHVLTPVTHLYDTVFRSGRDFAGDPWVLVNNAGDPVTITHAARGANVSTWTYGPFDTPRVYTQGAGAALEFSWYGAMVDAAGHFTEELDPNTRVVNFMPADDWITVNGTAGMVSIGHADPQAADWTYEPVTAFAAESASGGVNLKLVTQKPDVDGKGHLIESSEEEAQFQVGVTGDDWIEVAASGTNVTLTHGDPTNLDDVASYVGSVVWDGLTVKFMGAKLSFDTKGHELSLTDDNQKGEITFDGDAWVDPSGSGGTVTYSHNGPQAEAGQDDPVASLSKSGATLRLTSKKISMDAKGHVKSGAGATADHDLVFLGVDVVTDIRLDGLNLQYKKRRVYVLEADSEGDWQTWATGTDCPTS